MIESTLSFGKLNKYGNKMKFASRDFKVRITGNSSQKLILGVSMFISLWFGK